LYIGRTVSRTRSRSSILAGPALRKDSYARLATRPLHVLVFLLPLMALYEYGSIRYLSDPTHGIAETIGAFAIVRGFFDLFGAASLHLPPILLAVILLVWHVLERDPWKVRPHVLLGMLLESCIWMLPVLVFSHLLGSRMAGAGVGGELMDRTQEAKLTLSLGAGIYEELLFRLILVTLVHLVMVDILKLGQAAGYIAAAVISGVLFALYHEAARHDTVKFLFLAGAGVYFSALYVMRGFGIVVGAHALYDVVVLTLIAQPSSN
jgi:membrane protease YdiL (CAAX protease family)